MFHKLLDKYNRLGLIFLVFLFFIVPGRLGWFDGLPIEQFHELIFLTVILLLFFFLPIDWKRIPAGTVYLLILLLAVKILIGQISLPAGLNGSYYYPDFNGVIQQIRIDPEINFRNLGYSFKERPLPLGFFNNFLEFPNHLGEPANLPFASNWQGYLHVPPGKRSLALRSNGWTKIYLDHKLVFDTAVSPDEISFETTGPPNNIFPIKILFLAPAVSEKFIKLSWEGYPNSPPIRGHLFPEKFSNFQIYLDGLASIFDFLIKLAALAVVFFIFGRGVAGAIWKKWFQSWKPYLLLSLIIVLFSLSRRLLSEAQSPYFNLLAPGNDPRTYETFARHLLTSGDWTMITYEKGVYYWQILYYYLLAISHFIFGESLFPISFLQIIFLSATGLLAIQLTRLFIKKDSRLFLPIFFFTVLNPLAAGAAFWFYPIGTFLVVLAATFLFLGEKRTGYFLAAGITAALAVLMRTNFITWLPLIFLWFVLRWRRHFWRPALIFLIGLVITLSPVLIRNRLVAGQWAILSRSASTANFTLGTPVPADFRPSGTKYERLNKFLEPVFDGRAEPVIQWIVERPGDYLKVLKKKFLTQLGVGETADAGWLIVPFLIFIISSVIFLIKPGLFSEKARRSDWLPLGGFILIQLITLTIFSVNNSRYTMPIIPFLWLFVFILPLPFVKNPLPPNLRERIMNNYNFASWPTRIFLRLRWLVMPFEIIEPSVPKTGVIIDVGCGHGLLAHYLAASGPQRYVIGIEKNKNLTSISKKSARGAKNLEFRTGDAAISLLPKSEAIIFIDLLHHLSYADQKKALAMAVRSLRGDGRLIIKEIEKEKTWRYYWNLFHDRILRQSGPTFHKTSLQLKAELRALGLKIETEAHYYHLAYHHNLLVARTSQ